MSPGAETGGSGAVDSGGPGSGPGTGGRRRGRRPAGADTRAALLAAARLEFTERGFDGATVRMIAERAGVDPAMVNHWFGGKDRLFVAALQIPVDVDQVVASLLTGDLDRMGERIMRTFLTVWDAAGGGAMAALLRSVASHEQAARMLREFVTHALFGPLAAQLDVDHPQLRATLCGSQVIGIGLTRYVVRLQPLASVDREILVTAVAPNLQRYLTAPLGLPPD